MAYHGFVRLFIGYNNPADEIHDKHHSKLYTIEI